MDYESMSIEALEALKAERRIAEKAIRAERATIQEVLSRKYSSQNVKVKLGELSAEERALLLEELTKVGQPADQVVQLGVAQSINKALSGKAANADKDGE